VGLASKMRIYLLLLICFLSSPLFGYKSFEILSEQGSIEVLKTPKVYTKEMRPSEAYKAFKDGLFSELPASARSFGFSDKPLWFALEISNKSERAIFLSLNNPSLEIIECFVYQNDILVARSKSGAFTALTDREFVHLDPRFALKKDPVATTYIFKVTSSGPLIAPILIGTEGDITATHIPDFIVFAVFAGCFFSLFLYNLMLYITTKERDYLLYTAYIFFFFILMSSVREYFTPLLQWNPHAQNILKALSLQGTSLLLTLFTLSFLNIKSLHPKLHNISIFIGVACTLSFVAMAFGTIGQVIATISIITLMLLCTYLGVLSYSSGYHPAKYYLLALGGFFIGILTSILMINGFIDYNLPIASAQLLGSIWEMIILSLALGYKIKMLQGEKNEALSKIQTQEKMLFLQSRYASVGELVGNITHQWRQPLNEIGAIQANVKASILYKGDIAKDKLLNSVELSYDIIKHLSDTIDTFYRFFSYKSGEMEKFDVDDELHNIQKMVKYSFDTDHVKLVYESGSQHINTRGNRNEFAHAILNIVINAKDALVKRHVDEPTVTVRAYKNDQENIITIEDNAGGIAEEPIEKIFEPCSSSKQEGIGIGLFITKTIVEQRMHGRISVENSTKGAFFTLHLPFSHEPTQEGASGESAMIESLNESALERIYRLEKELSRRNEVEKTLRQWENIFRQAHWAIALHSGTSSDFEMVNPAFEEMYGYSAEELKYMSVSDIVSTDSLDTLPMIQKRAFENGFVSVEMMHTRKDGSEFPVSVDITVVKDEQGEILYHIANIRDITEQREAQEALLLKRFALDHIEDSVFMVDKHAKFHYANEGACNTLGYTKEEFASLNVGDVDPDWPIEKWPEHWEALKEVSSMTMELRHRRKDGSIFPVEVSANYIEFGGKAYNMAIARDITQRKAAEKELMLISRALNNTNEAVYIMIQDTIIQVNDGACKMLGYSRKELTSMSILGVDKDATMEDIASIGNSIAKGESARFERKHYAKDGRILDVEIVANLFEHDGVTYSFSAVRDITEQKKAREKLLLQDFALNRINEAVYLIDENSMFHYANEGACNALGYTKDELLTLGVIDIDPNCTTGWWNIHWDVIKEQKSAIGQTAHKRKDGSTFPIEVSSNYFEYNGVGYSLAVSRDITERRLLEEQKDNERMRLFFERQLVGMAITSPQKGWLHTNEKLQQMLGYTHEELTALTWTQMTYPDDLAADVEQFERLLCGEIEDYMLEKRFIRKDGTIVYTNLAVSCVRNDDRSVNYVLALMEDITERKLMEVSLKEANERYIQILDNSTDVIYLIEVTPEGRFVYVDVNAAYEEVTGIPRDVVIGLRVEDIEDETFRAILIDKFNTCLNAKSECDYIADYPFPAGIRTFHSVLTPIHDESGRIVRIVGSARDITDRNRMEAELATKERELRALAESSPGMMGTFHMRPDGSVYMPYASPNIYELFGVTVEQVREDATSILALSHPDDADMVVRTIGESAYSMSLWHIEYRIIHPTKGIRWMEGNTMPQPHPEGGVVWYGHIHDITERKKVEETVKLLQHSLEFSSESLFIMDADTEGFKFVQVNDTTCKTLGYSKEELLGGMGVVDIDPDYNADVLKASLEALKKVQSFTFETKHKAKDGRIYPVEIRSSYFEYGNKKYTLSLATDITERKQTEDALRNSEQKFRTLIENSSDSIARYDKNGCALYMNPRLLATLGTTLEEEIGKTPTKGPCLGAYSEYEIELNKAISTGESSYIHITVPDIGAGEKYHYVHIAPERDADGNIIGAIVFGRDVTELTTKTIELQKALEFNEGIIGAIPDLLFEIAPDGTYIGIWAQNEELLAFQKELLLGKNFKDILPLDAIEVSLKTMKEVDERGFSLGNSYSLDFPDGKRWFELSVTKKKMSGTYITLSRDITERKQLEEELQKERKFLVDAQRVAHTGSWYVDLRNETLSWSDETYRIFELDKDSVADLHATFYEYVHPEDRVMVRAPYEETLKTREPYEIEHRVLMPDGRIKYVIERCEHAYADDGTPLYSIGTVQDITERKLIEKRLEESHAFLTKLIDSLPDPIFVKDREHKWLILNKANYDFAGIEYGSLIGKSDYDFFPKEEADIFRAKDEEVFTSGKVNINEEYFTSSDGVTHYIQTLKAMFVGTDGKEYLVGTIRDLSERKEMEEKLRRSETSLKEAQKIAKLGSWELEFPSQKLTWSDEIYRMFELDSEHEIASYETFLKFVHPEDREMVNSAYADSLKNMLPYEIAHRVVMPDGRIKYVTEACKTHYDENGNPTLSIGAVQDVTERKQMEKELENSFNFLNRLIDSIHDPIFVKDRKHRWILLNDAFCTLLGQPKEALLGKSDYDFFPMEEADVFWMKDEAVFESSDVNINEEAFTSSDGVTYHIQTIKSMFDLANGEKHLVGTIRDITERKEMEEKLRELNTTLEQKVKERTAELQEALEFNEGVINAIPDLLFELDENGKYLNIWAAYSSELLATQKELLIGNTVHNVLSQDAAGTIMEALSEANQNGQSHGKTIKIELPQGDAYFELSVSKKANTFLVLSHDITERKKLETLQQERLKLEERLSKIAASVPGVNYIFEKTAEGVHRFTYLAPSFEGLIGISTDEAMADFGLVLSAVHPDDVEKVKQSIVKTAAEFTNWHEEFRVVHSQKGVIWIEGQSKPETSENNSTLWYGFFHDITERKATEEALAKSEEAFRAIVENSLDVIARYDLDCRRVYVNPMMQILMGKPLDEILGKTPSEHSPLPASVEFEKLFALVVSEGKEVALEMPYFTSEGEERWGHQRIVPEFDAKGQVVGVMVIGRDMTEYKKSIRQLKLLETAVDEADEAIYIAANDASIMYINNAACKMLGYSKKELTNMKLYEIDTHIKSDEIGAMFDNGRIGVTIVFDTKHKAKDGRILDVHVAATYFEFDGVGFGISIVKDNAKK
jgi:PAS domain S-box-containing protein